MWDIFVEDVIAEIPQGLVDFMTRQPEHPLILKVIMTLLRYSTDGLTMIQQLSAVASVYNTFLTVSLDILKGYVQI